MTTKQPGFGVSDSPEGTLRNGADFTLTSTRLRPDSTDSFDTMSGMELTGQESFLVPLTALIPQSLVNFSIAAKFPP